MPRTTKTSLLEPTINYDTSDFSEHQCICHTRLLFYSYSRSVSTFRGDSRVVNELSAYAFSTYGTRYDGSILTSTYLDVLSILMFFIGFHSLQYQPFSQRCQIWYNLPNIWTTSSYWDLLGFVLVW